MSKVLQRLLVFFIGLPLVIGIVFLNFYNHLPLQFVLLIFSALGACEFYNMLSNKVVLFKKQVIVLFTSLLPLASYLFLVLDIPQETCIWIYVIEALILMAIESFKSKTFENSITKISHSLLIIFYTGFMLTFITRMTKFNHSVYIIALYFIFVFMCDSAAWFFGILFGKNNKGLVAASPNKSVAGFIGGIFGSIASGVIYVLLFKNIFGEEAIWKIILIGFITCLAAITGDIIESVFKRSTNVKDSGNIIPGRGGVLDCMDSLITAAPVFYAGIYFLFNF